MAKYLLEMISAGLMYLLFPGPRVFPAHRWSYDMNGADSFVLVILFELKEWTFIQKLAAFAAIPAVSFPSLFNW